MANRRIPLTQLIGKTASGSKSEHVGINGYQRIGLSVLTDAAVSAGAITIKYANSNSDTQGVAGPVMNYPAAGNSKFNIVGSDVNVASVAFVEITTTLVDGVIVEAYLELSNDI